MSDEAKIKSNLTIANRFRGYLPVVIDVETSGFNAKTNALLEIAAVPIILDENQKLVCSETIACHVEPFEGSILEPKALEFNGIDPHHPFRMAKPEKEALKIIFDPIRTLIKETACTRAILVGHNSMFDLGFLNAAIERTKIKRSPFHSFSSFDTATLSGLAYGQTVLARAIKAAEITWDNDQAHSAVYDTEKTAELFCKIINQWDSLTAQAGINIQFT
ncbi:Ribonuclease T [hydrothermal vent metagenome]|uniref:Ribonuclease T n=1 Tax=hydrothermal vent metagenome TaxID=652676 RepID=A0A3B0ZVQ5_9ZZZZ